MIGWRGEQGRTQEIDADTHQHDGDRPGRDLALDGHEDDAAHRFVDNRASRGQHDDALNCRRQVLHAAMAVRLGRVCRPAMSTAKKVSSVASASTTERTASESRPRLPVSSPTTSLRVVSRMAAAMEMAVMRSFARRSASVLASTIRHLHRLLLSSGYQLLDD